MKKKKYFIFTTSFFTVILLGTSLFANAKINSAFGTENKIFAFAEYDFSDDTVNLGTDSSGNGFDLLAKSVGSYKGDVCKIVDDSGDKYLEITNKCGINNDAGSFLYAPQLGETGRDVSDLIYGDFTVSVKLKFDSSVSFGSNYILTFGRYGDCLTIVPYANGLEFQLYNSGIQGLDSDADSGKREIERYRAFYSLEGKVDDYKNDWHVFTIVGNNSEKSMTVYDGSEKINDKLSYKYLLPEDKLPDFKGAKLSDEKGNSGRPYTMCLGAQCTYLGTSSQQYGSAKYKFLKIYNCALSSANVENLSLGIDPTLDNETNPTKDAVVIKAQLKEGDTFNNKITDIHSVDKVIVNELPETIELEFNNGDKLEAGVSWFKTNNKDEKNILGLPQLDGYYNLNKSLVKLDFIYVADFKYDKNLVAIDNITLDNETYLPGTELAEGKDYNLKFKVTKLSSKKEISKIMCEDIKYKANSDGYVSITISGKRGALVEIICASKQGEITYLFLYNNEEYNLGTSIYTPDGQQGVCTFNDIAQEINGLNLVDGKKFEVIGLYKDEEMTMPFTSADLDYENPSSIILCAKAEIENESKGCGSSIEATSIIITLSSLSLVALVVVKFLTKRKEENK